MKFGLNLKNFTPRGTHPAAAGLKQFSHENFTNLVQAKNKNYLWK